MNEPRRIGCHRTLKFARANRFRYSERVTAIRRRIRTVAFAWLLCQVASLSAFVPEICCISHAEEAAAKEKAAACHESPAPEQAPKDGDACPMHHGTSSHDCCVMTNACDGPGTHLASLFSYIGVPETPASPSHLLESIAAFQPPSEPVLSQRSIPDAPPPKA
jgi:hypothetical protein